MSYNMHELPKYINTAGKITVVTSLIGVVVFAIIFLLNIGTKEFQHVEAQGANATTSVTVLNTPPQWTIDAQEEFESSTTTPTNSGYVVSWVATATDNNDEDYYLLICSDSSAPSSTDGGAPVCNSPIQWAVSAAASSGVQVRAATTTSEDFPPFAESNDWYAWVCDGIATTSRCNATFKQGTGTTSSPFNVNRRPSFTAYSNGGPADPGGTIVFYATSTDADVVDDPDTMQLIICSTASFSTSTDSCDATTIATSTFSASTPLTASYSVDIPTQDDTYNAFAYVVDQHGHEASGGQQGQNAAFTVNNVAPTAPAAQVTLDGGTALVLSEEAGETTGFTLQYVASDNNSCENSASGDEIVDFRIAVYRTGIGSSTCNGTGDAYNPNNCYDTGVSTTTWNISCTASSTSCTYNGLDDFDTTQVWDCTFPLWYVADPTDGTSTQTVYFNETWAAAVAPIDDQGASSTLTETSFPQELNSFMMFSLDTVAIPYGPLEPGDQTDTLVASTTLRATGNVGLDELLSGESMCPGYTNAVTCANSSTSTIAESNQVFATSSVSYATATAAGFILSSTTQSELEINVAKPTATSTQTSEATYWGIAVPGTITLAGAYTGENTIWGKVSEPTDWGP